MAFVATPYHVVHVPYGPKGVKLPLAQYSTPQHANQFCAVVRTIPGYSTAYVQYQTIRKG